ncbi:serine O-acetyltransferase [Roseiarcus sp.]|uniref:serine O-acetyltransferase n=1 Tax=Roseiarcus sp. TaxID=1969460 RepID=UPI003F9C9ACD
MHALQRQIELELALAKEWKGDSRIDSPRRAPDIVRDFAAELPSVRAVLDTDVRAAFEGDPSAKSIDEIVFCFPGFAAVIRHRLAHALYDLGVTMLARIVAEVAHSQTGIDIHPGPAIADIGCLVRRAALFVLAMAAGMALYSGFATVPSTPAAEVALDVDVFAPLSSGRPLAGLLQSARVREFRASTTIRDPAIA